MYHVSELIIRLSALEIQQALAIDLDRDSSEAIQFIKEKIVNKYFQSPCKVCFVSGNGANPLVVRRCSSACCPGGYRFKR